MKFTSYEIRKVVLLDGDEVCPASDCNLDGNHTLPFWSLYARHPVTNLICNVWDAPTFAEIRDIYQNLTGCALPEQEQDYFDLPVDPPAKRTEPDGLTAGFMAIGAETEFRRQTAKGARFVLWGGHLGFIVDVLQHGLLLDKVADYIDKHGGHPGEHHGCWCYEVAEVFGAKFAEQVLLDCDSSKSAEILLREIMLKRGYDPELLEAAFKKAKNHA